MPKTKKLCYDFNPCDPGKSRSNLEECIKGLKKALSLKLPTEEKDGVAKFTCAVAGCKKITHIGKTSVGTFDCNMKLLPRLQKERPILVPSSTADKGRSTKR